MLTLSSNNTKTQKIFDWAIFPQHWWMLCCLPHSFTPPKPKPPIIIEMLEKWCRKHTQIVAWLKNSLGHSGSFHHLKFSQHNLIRKNSRFLFLERPKISDTILTKSNAYFSILYADFSTYAKVNKSIAYDNFSTPKTKLKLPY